MLHRAPLAARISGMDDALHHRSASLPLEADRPAPRQRVRPPVLIGDVLCGPDGLPRLWREWQDEQDEQDERHDHPQVG
jgi:hypothetical protein